MEAPADPLTDTPANNDETIHDSKGWDGKLRVNRRAVVTNSEILSDPEYSDENAPPVPQINPDEGSFFSLSRRFRWLLIAGRFAWWLWAWLWCMLESKNVHLSVWCWLHCCHRRSISSIAVSPQSLPYILNGSRKLRYRMYSLRAWRRERRLSRSLQKLCLRQNAISHIEFPANLGPTLRELDLYDNLISHIRGFDDLLQLTSLDLSFNKIKHIKQVDHLKELKDIYFVQNKIQKIEGLDGLTKLRNLELAANRIRVGCGLEVGCKYWLGLGDG